MSDDQHHLRYHVYENEYVKGCPQCDDDLVALGHDWDEVGPDGKALWHDDDE